MKSCKIWILVGLLFCTQAASAEQGTYVGIGFGSAEVDIDLYDSSSSSKLFVGTKISNNAAVELAYLDLGIFDVQCNCATYVEVAGVEVSFLGYAPLNDDVSIIGKAGFYAWHMDATLFGSDYGSTSGTDLTIGVGIDFKLSDSVKLRGAYDLYQNVDDVDITNTSLSLLYNF